MTPLLLLGALSFLSSCLVDTVAAEDVTVINNCGQRLYVKNRMVNSAPFFLQPNTRRTITVNRQAAGDTWSPRPRIWAHVGRDNNGANCDTPKDDDISLAEFNYEQSGKVWWDVSMVDGYNLPVTITVPGNNAGNCRIATCTFNIDRNCPEPNKVRNKGRVVLCKNLDRDNGSSDYVKQMKGPCPGVYTWSRDNDAGMRDCLPGNNAMVVTFC